MAAAADAIHLGMVNPYSRRPAYRRVTSIAVAGGIDMSAVLACCCCTVMTGRAGGSDSTVVENSIGPVICVVTVVTGIATL